MNPADVLYGAARMLAQMAGPLGDALATCDRPAQRSPGLVRHPTSTTTSRSWRSSSAGGRAGRNAGSGPGTEAACDGSHATARDARRHELDLGTKADGRVRDHPGDPSDQRPDRRQLHPQPRLQRPLGAPQSLSSSTEVDELESGLKDAGYGVLGYVLTGKPGLSRTRSPGDGAGRGADRPPPPSHPDNPEQHAEVAPDRTAVKRWLPCSKDHPSPR